MSSEQPLNTREDGHDDEDEENENEIVELDEQHDDHEHGKAHDIDGDHLHHSDPDPDVDNCSICLQPISDRTVIVICSHEFCFDCLLVWSEQSRRCPLCSQSLGTYLIHHIRSRYDYQKHYLAPLNLRVSSPRPLPLPRTRNRNPNPTYNSARTEREWGKRREEREVADRLDRAIAKRRWIYEHDLYAKHVASNPHTSYRPSPTPGQFAASSDLVSRTTAFLRRELMVWNGLDVEFLTTFIISLMKALDIRSEGAVKLLAEFLDMDAPEGSERRYAEHFAHEVYSYVRSPYRDLFVYDSVVQYDTPPGILPPHQLQSPRRYGYGHEAEVGTEPGPSTRGNGNSGGAHTSRSRVRSISGSRVHSRSPRRAVQPGRRARSRSTSNSSWSPSGRRYPSLKEREREVEKEERRWDRDRDRDRDSRERRRERKGKGKEWPDDDLGYEFDRQGKGKGKEREVFGEEKKRDWNRDNESSRSRRRRGRTSRLSDTDMDTDMDVVEDRDRDKKDGTRKRRRLGRAEAEAEAEDGREEKGKGKGKARTSRAEEKLEKDRDMDMDRKGAHKVRAGESKYTGDGTSETGLSLGYKVGCEREIREDLSRWDGASAKLKGDVDVEEPGNEEERLRSEAKSGTDEVTLKGKGKETRRGDLANLNVDVDVEMADGLGEPLATVDSPAHPQPRRTRPRYRNLLQSVQAHLDIDIDHGAPRKATIPKTVPSRSREDAEHGSVPNSKSLLGRVSDHYLNTETTPIPRSGGLSLSSSAPTSAPLTSSTPTPTSTPSRTYPRNDDNSVINITVKNGIAVNGESLSTSSYDETGLPTATTTTTRIMEMETHLGMPSPELTSSSSRMSAPDIMARTRARMRLADMNTMNTAIATATVAAPSLSPGHQEGSGPDNDKSQLSPSLAHSAPGSLSSSGPTTTAKPLTSQEIMKRTRARLAQMKDKKENSSRRLSALTVPFSVYSVTLGSNANDDTVTVSVNHAESPRSSSSKTTRNQACGTETETLPEFGRGQIEGLTFSDSHAVALEERRSSLYPGSGPSHESDLRLRLLSRLEEERRENANMAMAVLDNTAHEDETHGQDEFRAVNSNALSVPNIPSDLSTDPQEKERKLRARAQLRVRLAAAKKAVVQLQV